MANNFQIAKRKRERERRNKAAFNDEIKKMLKSLNDSAIATGMRTCATVIMNRINNDSMTAEEKLESVIDFCNWVNEGKISKEVIEQMNINIDTRYDTVIDELSDR